METVSALLVICAGNSPVIGEIPAQRPVTQSFYVFFDLRLDTRLSKQWWSWWFETPSCPLWRYCNNPCVLNLFYYILLIWVPFHQSLVRERQLMFHLSGINRLITIRTCMMTSSNGNIFRVTGPLCGEFTGPRWIPHTKASDAELWCFLWTALE